MIKILELFGGIGACSKALERLGIDYKIVDYVEIDKYAVASFNAMHNTDFKPQDITTWNKNVEVDLIMHGSPCQDFSLAGKQAGGDIGSGTRSSLMYETIRIVGKLRPKYVIWENVKNLISKKHRHNFDTYLQTMEALGYKNYYQVLNAKDYGIPQNRERVFTISILNDDLIVRGSLQDHASIRNDGICPTLTSAMGMGGGQVPIIYKNNINFEFPPKQELKLKLKDMLEDEVDEKYYLSNKMVNFFYKNEEKQKELGNGFRFNVSDGNVVAKTITTRAGSRMDDNFLKIKNATKKGYLEAYEGDGIDISSRMKYHRGNVQSQSIQTLDCSDSGGHGVVTNNLRIRKLTPKECWRLMGFDDTDFEKAEKVNSNTQLYKQAGNSIVVNVLEAILGKLLEEL